MARGTVKSFNKEKGFGYITPEDGDGADQGIYVHTSVIEGVGPRELTEGQTVDYKTVQNMRGRVMASYARVVESD